VDINYFKSSTFRCANNKGVTSTAIMLSFYDTQLVILLTQFTVLTNQMSDDMPGRSHILHDDADFIPSFKQTL